MRVINQSYLIRGDISNTAVLHNIADAARVCYRTESGSSDEALVARLIKSQHEAMLEHSYMTVYFTTDRSRTNWSDTAWRALRRRAHDIVTTARRNLTTKSRSSHRLTSFLSVRNSTPGQLLVWRQNESISKCLRRAQQLKRLAMSCRSRQRPGLS